MPSQDAFDSNGWNESRGRSLTRSHQHYYVSGYISRTTSQIELPSSYAPFARFEEEVFSSFPVPIRAKSVRHRDWQRARLERDIARNWPDGYETDDGRPVGKKAWAELFPEPLRLWGDGRVTVSGYDWGMWEELKRRLPPLRSDEEKQKDEMPGNEDGKRKRTPTALAKSQDQVTALRELFNSTFPPPSAPESRITRTQSLQESPTCFRSRRAVDFPFLTHIQPRTDHTRLHRRSRSLPCRRGFPLANRAFHDHSEGQRRWEGRAETGYSYLDTERRWFGGRKKGDSREVEKSVGEEMLETLFRKRWDSEEEWERKREAAKKLGGLGYATQGRYEDDGEWTRLWKLANDLKLWPHDAKLHNTMPTSYSHASQGPAEDEVEDLSSESDKLVARTNQEMHEVLMTYRQTSRDNPCGRLSPAQKVAWLYQLLERPLAKNKPAADVEMWSALELRFGGKDETDVKGRRMLEAAKVRCNGGPEISEDIQGEIVQWAVEERARLGKLTENAVRVGVGMEVPVVEDLPEPEYDASGDAGEDEHMADSAAAAQDDAEHGYLDAEAMLPATDNHSEPMRIGHELATKSVEATAAKSPPDPTSRADSGRQRSGSLLDSIASATAGLKNLFVGPKKEDVKMIKGQIVLVRTKDGPIGASASKYVPDTRVPAAVVTTHEMKAERLSPRSGPQKSMVEMSHGTLPKDKDKGKAEPGRTSASEGDIIDSASTKAVQPPGSIKPAPSRPSAPLSMSSIAHSLPTTGTTTPHSSTTDESTTSPTSLTSTEDTQEAALAAINAVIHSTGQHYTAPLTSRAASLHQNNQNLREQEYRLMRETEALSKDRQALERLVKEGNEKLKSLGDLGNWSNLIGNELNVIEETLRIVEHGPDEVWHCEACNEVIHEYNDEDTDANDKGKGKPHPGREGRWCGDCGRVWHASCAKEEGPDAHKEAQTHVNEKGEEQDDSLHGHSAPIHSHSSSPPEQGIIPKPSSMFEWGGFLGPSSPSDSASDSSSTISAWSGDGWRCWECKLRDDLEGIIESLGEEELGDGGEEFDAIDSLLNSGLGEPGAVPGVLPPGVSTRKVDKGKGKARQDIGDI